MAKSNFGFGLQKETASGVFTTLGEIRKMDNPEVIREYIDSTTQDSNGYKEKIFGGLTELGSFKVTLAVASGM
jgi:hypothetical protein